ncbi:MAG: DUF4398 domain-containing protein [Deltaproteobacteria bacterium]|nr:DUF4398 domain-containing protein [Deltaproteobacteria bacterium]
MMFLDAPVRKSRTDVHNRTAPFRARLRRNGSRGLKPAVRIEERLVRLALLLALAVSLLGCPPPPRPQQLDDLQLMLASGLVTDVTPRAPDAVAAARTTQAEAEAAWEDGDLELSARLSLLAQVQVRLAVALARQDLARERREEAEQTAADAEAAYAEIEARRQVLENRLSSLWAYRRIQEEVARERAQAVEEEALRAERLTEAERATWEKNWRAQARVDAAEARRTLEVARMLGVADAYPEAERMATEAIETALDAVDISPWRIERPLVDYAVAQADELRFRMLTVDSEGGAEAMAERVRSLAETYRSGFDPPFHVAIDPRGILLTLDAKSAELEIAFPEPARTALRNLRDKWTGDESLLCLVIVRSIDPECGEDCLTRTAELARLAAAEISGLQPESIPAAGDAAGASTAVAAAPVADAARIRSLGLGLVKPEEPLAGLSQTGAVRLEFLFFPRAVVPVSAP